MTQSSTDQPSTTGSTIEQAAVARDRVNRLKTNWLSDPCWDLASTDGFEQYIDELSEFEKHWREQWANADSAKRQTPDAKQDRLGLLGEELLAELRRLNARPSDSRSSATIKTSARPTPDVEVKSYADGLLDDAVTDAVEQYARARREIDELQANHWQQAVDAVADAIAEGAAESNLKPVARS